MNTINRHDQVKIGRGATDTGAWHRALEVARDLHAAGRWNGTGLIVIHNAYDSHRMASYEWLGGLAALKEGSTTRSCKRCDRHYPVAMTNATVRTTHASPSNQPT